LLLKEITAEDLRDAEDEMPVGNLLENIHAEPFPEFHDALLMARWTEMTALAGKGQQILVTAVFTLHPGETVVRVAAVEITVNDLANLTYRSLF
jgi:hypothetical protein